MPTYEYRCEQCKHQFEVFASMSDPAPAACESCGAGELTKVLFPVAVHYKGSGFYSTDYTGRGSTTNAGASSGEGSDASSPNSDAAAPSAPSTPSTMPGPSSGSES